MREWISVKDGLPKKSGCYKVIAWEPENDFGITVYYSEKYKEFNVKDDFTSEQCKRYAMDDVLYWKECDDKYCSFYTERAVKYLYNHPEGEIKNNSPYASMFFNKVLSVMHMCGMKGSEKFCYEGLNPSELDHNGHYGYHGYVY